MTKVTKLTKENIEMFHKYRDLGIKIGFSAHDPDNWDLDKIRDLTDKHRVMMGLKKAKHFAWAKSPDEALRFFSKTGATVHSFLYGNHDIPWLNYYNYYRCELGLTEETDKIVHLLELTKYIGWMLMSSTDDVTIVCKKPIEVNTITTNNLAWTLEGKQENFTGPILHNENGPSMRYEDGFCVYHLWGQHIPEEYSWVCTTPVEKLSIEKIMRIDNTDVRSLALKKVGIERAFDSVERKTIHKKTFELGGEYELFSVNFGSGEEKYYRMVCPSKKEVHIEGAPPQAQTVDAVLGWVEYDPDCFNEGYVYIEPHLQS